MTRSGSTVRSLLPAVLLALTAFPGVASAELTKHHITLGLGYQKYLGENLKDDATGIDFTNAGVGLLGYRFSLKPGLDLVLDSKAAVSSDKVLGVDLTLTTTYFGPGIRCSGKSEGTRPYVQANFYVVNEEAEAEQAGVKISQSESGIGVGLAAGIDIRASRLLSIPIEASFNYAEPEDVLRGVGGSVGLTFNFGELH
jgi:hypothetical protein